MYLKVGNKTSFEIILFFIYVSEIFFEIKNQFVQHLKHSDFLALLMIVNEF